MTRINELQYSQFFIQWLNKKTCNMDYQVSENNEENSEIDAYAISKSNCYPKLNLQVATSHGEIFKRSAINTNRLKKGKDIIVGDVDIEKWIYDVIKKKDKMYSSEVKENLVLLIEGHIPTPAPEDIPKSQQYSDCPFKGIYYVSLPVYSSIETDYTKNGFVVPIKDMFA